MKTLLTEDKFKQLLKTQSDFDSRISTINLEDSKTAWFVELVEWFNTIEPFKNWKQNKGKSKDVQLGELADVLAFGLSIYLQVDERQDEEFIENMKYVQERVVKGRQTFNLEFLRTFANELERNPAWHLIVLQLPFTLAYDLYTVDELLEAYEQKMQVNHKRQDSGY